MERFNGHFYCLTIFVSGCPFLTGTCFKVSDWCALSAIVCLQMTFVMQIFFLSLRAPLSLGKIGAAGLFLVNRDEPAEALLRTHGRVFNSLSGAAVAPCNFPKHFRSCFLKIRRLFFGQLWGVGGGVKGRVSICFRFPQGTSGSTTFLLPSCSPSSGRLFSVGVAALRPLQVQLHLARELLSLDSYQQRLLCYTYP